ncbi:Importin subunit beta-1 [Astathelohania contejeani]|uniref:Importin subunit beta-1 n=1 Tax=Astathelohania contejeani TaxID=164912 RepID=A0ABQ7I0U5_9MICR|nr:Importin subunit beta-1 [Thelohania contejeani]
MNKEQIEYFLSNALSPDVTIRSTAEQEILRIQEQDFNSFLDILSNILGTEDGNPSVRMTAGIVMRNSLHANDRGMQARIEEKWIMVKHKQLFKEKMFSMLDNKNQRIRDIAIGCLASIARIEIPHNDWPQFFDYMRDAMAQGIRQQRGLLETVGQTCALLTNDLGYNFSQHSITIYQIFQQTLPSDNTPISLNNLKLSMEALYYAFKNDDRLIEILNVLFMLAKQNGLTAAALECLVKFTNVYYYILKDYMPRIIQEVNPYILNESDAISLQAIDFWSTIAEIEDEEEEAGSNSIIKANINTLLPILLHRLFKPEDYDDEEWTPHKAACSCLQLISQALKTQLTLNPILVEFVETNLLSPDSNRRAAAEMALGCIIYKAEDKNFLKKIIPNIISDMKTNTEATLWCLAKICEDNLDAVDPGPVLPNLINEAKSVIIGDNIYKANAAWLFYSMFANVAKGRNILWDFENVLSFFYFDLLNTLIRATECVNHTDYNLKGALFSALTELVKACAEDVSLILEKLISYLNRKIQECLEIADKATEAQFYIIEDLLSNYIVLAGTVAVYRTEEKLGKEKEILFQNLIRILGLPRQSYISMDVYIILSNFITPGSYFLCNIGSVIPYMVRDINNPVLCKSVVNLIGDIANTTNQGFLVYSSALVPSLVRALGTVPAELKPGILAVFGDVSLSMGLSFEEYLDVTMNILEQIVSLPRSGNEEYVDELRINVIQLFSCVLIGLGKNSKLLERNIQKVVYLVRKVVQEDEEGVCKKECLDILGDLITMYGRSMGLEEGWVDVYVGRWRSESNASRVMELLGWR